MASITTKTKYIQILGVAAAAAYGVFVVFLYAAEPRSLVEVSSKARTTLESVASKGTVAIGTYEPDAELKARGIAEFKAENYVAARDSLRRADPELRDPETLFYIAYSFYRQGWGRVSNDDALFNQALQTLERLEMIAPNYRASDAGLQLATPAELRAEVEDGLAVTASDFNPLRVFRERK